MRSQLKTCLIALMALGLTAGKKSKPVEEAPPAPAKAEVAEEVTEPVAEPEPEAQVTTPNADFRVKLSRADGTSKAGRVIRVERSEDWYAEDGWTDKAAKLTVTVEGKGTEKDVEWKAIKTIDISYLGKSEIDCTYDSEYSPLMWTCTMKTKSTVVLADGTWDAASRHKWKFVFEDGSAEEFWINKISERKQEETAADMNDPEKKDVVNVGLQVALQDAVIAAASKAVKRIEITAP